MTTKAQHTKGPWNKSQLADTFTIDTLIEMSKAGNMLALELAWLKVREAEEVANLDCYRLVAGKVGIDKLFNTIQRAVSELSKIERVGKTTLAKQVDESDIFAAIARATT
jgi:hypothetical protein